MIAAGAFAAVVGDSEIVLVPGLTVYVLGVNHPSPRTCVTVTVGACFMCAAVGVGDVPVEVIVARCSVNIGAPVIAPVSSRPKMPLSSGKLGVGRAEIHDRKGPRMEGNIVAIWLRRLSVGLRIRGGSAVMDAVADAAKLSAIEAGGM